MPTAGSASPTSMDRLVEVLDGVGVVLASSPPEQVTPTGTSLYDPGDPLTITAGDVVLGINVSVVQAQELMKAAAKAGACAVVLKPRTETDLLVAQAIENGVALLAIPDDLAWDQLQALIASALIATSHRDGDGSEIGDLFALCNAIAARVGAATTLEDPHFNLLAYSNLEQPIDEARRETILGRGNPSRWAMRLEEAEVPKQLRSLLEGVLRVSDPHGETRERLVAPVRAGTELLGFIWLVEGESPFDAAVEDALQEVVPLAATHLLRHRSFRDFGRRERGKLFREFLDGRSWDDQLARGLSVDTGAPCCVVAFALHLPAAALTTRDDVELSVKRSAAIDMITLTSEAFRRRVVCAWVGSTVYAFYPSMGPTSLARLSPLIADICRRASATLGIDVRAGIGSVVASPRDAQESRTEAERVLRALESGVVGDGLIAAAIDDVRVPSLLLSLVDLLKERDDFRLPSLDLVIRHDAEHSSTYLATLRAFIDHDGDIPAMAKELDVHVNTVRYRIRRAEQIAGMDLTDPGVRLVLALDLLVRSTTANVISRPEDTA